VFSVPLWCIIKMEFEFDKEMDSLLRQTARGETAFAAANPKSKIQNPKSLHLDADEISAFAENALPEKTKLEFTAHFADCDRCRKILSNVILLNAEATKKTVHAPETAKIQTIAPWYKRFFAVPNLAYAMGALVLIFGGLIVFTFLKSVPRNSEVSQARETPMSIPVANPDGETPAIAESNAAAMSNSASTMSNMSMTNSAPVHSSNASMANASTKGVSTNSNAATVSNKQTAAEKEKAKAEPPSASDSALAKTTDKSENQMSVAGASLAARNTQPTVKGEKRAQEENKIIKSDAPPKPAQSSGMTARSASDAPAKNTRNKEADKIETRAVGGKVFRHENGVWYDSAYSGQGATHIARGSEDFKKLDVGLRSIADAFGGTAIVVVWKGKAYRIQ